MQKKLEKYFKSEIKQTQKNIQKEFDTKLQELKEQPKRIKTLSSDESQEYALDNLPQNLKSNQPNQNQNLSINIRVGNEKRRNSNNQDLS